jgi:hypothetical protein
MPRRARNVEFHEPPTEIQDIGQNMIHLVSSDNPKPVKYIVGEYLKNNYYDMAKENGKSLDCPICMEDICCKKCFCLLPCGHAYHLSCLLPLDKCALCRN